MKAPDFLISAGIEFFTVDDTIFMIQDGNRTIINSIEDIPHLVIKWAEKEIKKNKKYQIGLRLIAGPDLDNQILKLIQCKFGGYDAFSDFDKTGRCQEEITSCPYEYRCAAAKYICKQNSYNLTFSEKKILRLIICDLADKQISYKLNVSEHTVRNHIQNMHAKLGTASKQGLVRFAVEHNL